MMLNKFWLKLKPPHLLLMVFCCLLILVAAITAAKFFPQVGDNWFWLIILLCPLAHLLMMRGHKRNNTCGKESDKESHKEAEYQCPKCGLKYKEKEWAEKCEAWCKKYKSCNLEITKYAINKGREKEVVKKGGENHGK